MAYNVFLESWSPKPALRNELAGQSALRRSVLKLSAVTRFPKTRCLANFARRFYRRLLYGQA